jgi:chlorobactene glucosyltransferase
MNTFSFGAVFNLEDILSTLLITAIALLVYLFFISFRSNRNIPSINAIRQRKDNAESIIKNDNGSNHQSIENVSVSIKDELLCSLPFVSIIVPARNEEECIERCLLSLLSQNYPNFEVIAVDDNSSDNTLEKMKGIRNKLQKQGILLPISSRLKIISLKSKPENWTGKTWASQQGLLQSKGDILLFTDADTYYMRKDVLLISILYMLKENIDVLTALLSPEKLKDFWLKMIIPLWDWVSVIFDINTPRKVNDPKSKVAYLLGSFFIIKRRILEEVGAFESVCQAIQEDKALGIRIKKMGYNLKIVKLNEMVLVNWSRGLSTLWHGIGGRTIAYLGIRNKVKVIVGLLIIFFVSALPFILLPYTFSIAIQKFSLIIHISEFIFQFEFYLLLLNTIACLMVNIGVAVKCKAYKLSPIFSLLGFFAAIFLIVSCFYNIASLLIAGKTKSITWKGRR